ncbi:MAG: peroxidase [Merismopedia sp. SIO2A8]|nr:peroxidase [Merismopedia sp. SIO2A8]
MTMITPQDRDDIQGIILSGYGHLYYTTYLLLTVTDGDRAKAWIKSILSEISTAKQWGKNPDGTTQKPTSACSLAFTHSGFRALGLLDKTLNTFPREFMEGMTEAKRSEILGDTGDSAPENWEFGGPETADIHLLLILNGTSPEQLDTYQQSLFNEETAGLSLVTQERGFRVPSEKEHFGFNDSVSQPAIAGLPKRPNQLDSNTIATGEILLGYPDGYNIWPITPVVPKVDDPTNILPDFPNNEIPEFHDFGRNGSFLVYRKLAQDVAGFWTFIAAQNKDTDGQPNPAAMTLMASKFVGRWPSGAPLALYPNQDNPQLEDKNNFSYIPNDEKGFGCPLGAHIRRTNPRDSLIDFPGEDSTTTSNRHRILRRGSLYGPPLFPLDEIDQGNLPLDIENDGQPRGTHFFCLNSDIGRQFEFLQQTWANNPQFNGLYNNRDPIIGNNDGNSMMVIPQCPVRRRVKGLPRFVSVRGGAYFFLPSMRSLNFLVH